MDFIQPKISTIHGLCLPGEESWKLNGKHRTQQPPLPKALLTSQKKAKVCPQDRKYVSDLKGKFLKVPLKLWP